MREILFRGKRKTDNKWLYGFPYVTRKNAVKINWYCSDFGSMRTDEVDPETVGQYTGLTDKNGVKIFEGDILRDDDTEENGVVVFEEGEFCVVFDNVITHGISAIAYRCYIRGNIHDNPELIGG